MVRLLLPTVIYDLGLCAPCTVSHSFGKSLLYYTAWENKLIPRRLKNQRECLIQTVCACAHPLGNLETTVHASVLHNRTLEHQMAVSCRQEAAFNQVVSYALGYLVGKPGIAEWCWRMNKWRQYGMFIMAGLIPAASTDICWQPIIFCRPVAIMFWRGLRRCLMCM